MIAVVYVPEVDGSWTVGVGVGVRSRKARRLIKYLIYNLFQYHSSTIMYVAEVDEDWYIIITNIVIVVLW